MKLCRQTSDGSRGLGAGSGGGQGLKLERDEVACTAGSANFGVEAQARQAQFRFGQVGDGWKRGALLNQNAPWTHSMCGRKTDSWRRQSVYQLDHCLGRDLVLQLRHGEILLRQHGLDRYDSSKEENRD